MKLICGRQALTVLYGLVLLVLVGCSANPRGPIPVEDRVAGQSSSRQAKVVTPQAHAPSASTNSGAVSTPINMGTALPSSENAGKPGYYSVRPGDTLTKIALDHGQAWRDIVKWNGLDNPNVIEVDQVLRVVPDAKVAVAPKPVVQPGNAPAAAGQPAPSVQATPATTSSDDGMVFSWPHSGQVITGFDETKNKGLDFAGKAGDPVLAAADGKVVYAGSGLRGYGNLVILKHNNTYLTAYAHNQTLLVKEEQAVVKGQRIAEMGNSDADRVKLHFEIRKQGKPVDPSKYLPSRP